MRGDPDSIKPNEHQISISEAAESTSEPSNESSQLKSRRTISSRRESNSSESEDDCYEVASKSSTEKSDQLIIEMFHQDLSLQQKRDTSPHPFRYK